MSTQTPTRRSRRWIEDWRPEDAEFWETTGSGVARRNLVWSIFAEHVGFSVWLIWSVSSAFLLAQGFEFTPQQLFLLVALPNLVGSLLRLPYTFAVPKFGGRNWTIVSGAMLLLPDAALRVRRAGPVDALLGVLPDRRDRGRRGRQLRLVDGQHQLLLPRPTRRARRSASTRPAATSASR